MWVTATVHLDGEEEVRANHCAEREYAMRNGEPALRMPALLHVAVGNRLDLWGEPHALLRVLCDALARAREAEAAGSQEVVTDLGGMA